LSNVEACTPKSPIATAMHIWDGSTQVTSVSCGHTKIYRKVLRRCDTYGNENAWRH